MCGSYNCLICHHRRKSSARAARLGEIFRVNIRNINSPLIKDVRGKGLLNAVVINEAQSVKKRTAWQLCLLMKSRGVLAKPTHQTVIRFAPPLVITESALHKAIAIIKQAILDFDIIEHIPDDSPEHAAVADIDT